jgi:hypothetical protein
MRRAARGQSLIVTVMIMLVVVLMVFFTFSVGERTRRKMRMQALADSAAYSSAVAEARAMNFYAMSNRAIVSHLVSAISVIAHNSWVNWYEDMLAAAALNWWNIAQSLHDRAMTDASCLPCRARLLGAADKAFNVAEWYAFAVPTHAGQVAIGPNVSTAIFGLPLPWSPFTPPHPNQVYTSPGGTPVPTPFVPGSGWTPGRFDDGCYNLHVSSTAISSGQGDGADCLGKMGSLRGMRGAEWLHFQFHAKVDGDWCQMMLMGRREHYDLMQMLRAQQLNVERELYVLLAGQNPTQARVIQNPLDIDNVRGWLFVQTPVHVDSDENQGRYNDDTESSSGGGIDFYDANNQKSSAPAPRALADALAQRVDPQVKVTKQSAQLSGDLYLQAIVPQYAPGNNGGDPSNPAKNMAHKDFDQMAFVTRYPTWLFQRTVKGFTDHLLREQNWAGLDNGARAIAGGFGAVTNRAWYYGNSKLMSNEQLLNLGITDTSTGYAFQPVNDRNNTSNMWWNLQGQSAVGPWGTYPDYVAYTGDRVSNWYSYMPADGDELAKEMSDLYPDVVFGKATAHGSLDYGRVTSDYNVGTPCNAVCDHPSRTLQQYEGRDGSWNRGDGEAPRGVHFFHGSGPNVGHRVGSINQSTDHMYVGHMRFAASDQPNDLWNMPRTVVLLTQPTKDPRHSTNGQQGRFPWDFDFQISLLGNSQFSTMKSSGDTQGGDMAAAASGLVYYHQPTKWDEPPNLWSPFWRAKLHPLKPDHLKLSGHAATTAALNALPAGALNE